MHLYSFICSGLAQAVPKVSELRWLVQEPQEGDDAEAGSSSSGGALWGRPAAADTETHGGGDGRSGAQTQGETGQYFTLGYQSEIKKTSTLILIHLLVVSQTQAEKDQLPVKPGTLPKLQSHIETIILSLPEDLQGILHKPPSPWPSASADGPDCGSYGLNRHELPHVWWISAGSSSKCTCCCGCECPWTDNAGIAKNSTDDSTGSDWAREGRMMAETTHTCYGLKAVSLTVWDSHSRWF